jgi:electron transport complex protein RnfC
MDGFWPTFIRRRPIPPSFSEKTLGRPIASFPSPQTAIIPLQEASKTPYQCFIKRGEEVTAGQKIGRMGHPPFDLAVHASISGKVREIDFYPGPHGFDASCVAVDSVGKEEVCLLDSSSGGAGGLIHTFLEAGIPLDYPKLSGGTISAILVNGTEFDPSITIHHQLILEKAQEIMDGLKALTKAFSIPEAVICLEKNRPLLFKALEKAGKGWKNLTIQQTAKSYPATADDLLIKETIQKRRRSDHPGAAIIDMALVIAVSEALHQKIPFIARSITCAGSGIRFPQNVRVRIGTPFSEVIRHCGGELDDVTQIIMGGLLMGMSQVSPHVPVTKKTTGILAMVAFAMAGGHQSRIYQEGPCVRCAKCVDCCPVSILPNKIAAYCQKRRFEEARENGLFLCIECGLCSYVCPARIPLTQIFKETKSRESLQFLEESP